MSASSSSSSSSSWFPAPHAMCSPAECADRQSHMELHPFECTASTFGLGPRLRVADPRLATKKYRRSAAGGGVTQQLGGESDDGGRTLEQLETTVNHLLSGVLVRQRTFGTDVMSPRSLAETAAFVDDRIRAVQVDLTTSLEGRSAEEWRRVRRVQARLVRYGILMQYLLVDLTGTSRYEAKFGWTALRTALGSYFGAWDAASGDYNDENDDEDDDDFDELDEMRSYAALLHLSSALRSREASGGTAIVPPPPPGIGYVDENGSGIGALLAGSNIVRCFPSSGRRRRSGERNGGNGGERSDRRWMRALEVAAAADGGNYVRAFRLLCDDEDEGNAANNSGGTLLDKERRWRVLCRCCVVPSLNVLRIDALRRYNRALGKNERVPASDLAELLRLPGGEQDGARAVRFCADVGLPVVASTEGGTADAVIMKAAPVAVPEEKKEEGEAVRRRLGRPGREEDAFVFGTGRLEDGWEGKEAAAKRGESQKKTRKKKEKDKQKKKDPTAGMSSLQLALMKMKVKDEEPDDWEEREDDSFEEIKEEAAANETKEDDDDVRNGDLERTARTDEDGVVVPPGRVLLDLVR